MYTINPNNLNMNRGLRRNYYHHMQKGKSGEQIPTGIMIPVCIIGRGNEADKLMNLPFKPKDSLSHPGVNGYLSHNRELIIAIRFSGLNNKGEHPNINRFKTSNIDMFISPLYSEFADWIKNKHTYEILSTVPEEFKILADNIYSEFGTFAEAIIELIPRGRDFGISIANIYNEGEVFTCPCSLDYSDEDIVVF